MYVKVVEQAGELLAALIRNGVDLGRDEHVLRRQVDRVDVEDLVDRRRLRDRFLYASEPVRLHRAPDQEVGQRSRQADRRRAEQDPDQQ
jgi:hypothetical protein